MHRNMAVRGGKRSGPAMTFTVHVTVMAAVLFLSHCPGARSASITKRTGKGNTFDFAEVDRDGSGCVQGPLEKQKFRLYIGSILEGSLLMSDVERALQAGRITRSADINRDGKICECDLLTIFLTDSGSKGRRRHAFRVVEDGSIFDSVDADGDGYLADVSEKAGLTHKLAQCVSDVKARTIVEAMAKLQRDDGKLARTEYMLFINSPHNFPPTPRLPSPPLAHPSPRLSHGSRKTATGLPFPLGIHNRPPALPPKPVVLQPKPVLPVQNNLQPVQNVHNPVPPSRPVWNPGPVSESSARGGGYPVQSGTRPFQPPRPVYQPVEVQTGPPRPVFSNAGPRPVIASAPVQNQPGPVRMGYGPVQSQIKPVQKEPKPVQKEPKPQRLRPPQSMLLSDGTRITFPSLPLAEEVEETAGDNPVPSPDTNPHPPPFSPLHTGPQAFFPPQPASPPLPPPRPEIYPGTQAPPGPLVQAYPFRQPDPVSAAPASPVRPQLLPVMPPIPLKQAGYWPEVSAEQPPGDSRWLNSILHQRQPVPGVETIPQQGREGQGSAMAQRPPAAIPAAPAVYQPRYRNRSRRPPGPLIQLDLESEHNPLNQQHALKQPGFSQPESANPGFSQSKSANPGFFQSKSANPGFSQSKSANPGFFQSKSANPGFFQSKSANPGFFQSKSANPGFFQSQSAQPGSRQSNSIQADFYRPSAVFPTSLQHPSSARESLVQPDAAGRNGGRPGYRAGSVPSHPQAAQSVQQAHSRPSAFRNQAAPALTAPLPELEASAAELDRQLQQGGAWQRPPPHWDAISQKIYNFIVEARHTLPSQTQQRSRSLANRQPVPSSSRAFHTRRQPSPRFLQLQKKADNPQAAFKPGPVQHRPQESERSQLLHKLENADRKSDSQQAQSQKRKQAPPASRDAESKSQTQEGAEQREHKAGPASGGLKGLPTPQSHRPPPPKLQGKSKEADSVFNPMA